MSLPLASPGWTCPRDGTVYPSRAHFEQKLARALVATNQITRREEVEQWLSDHLADLIWQSDILNAERPDYLITDVRIVTWTYNKMLEIIHTGPVAGWEVVLSIDHIGKLPRSAVTGALARLGGLTYRVNHGETNSTVRMGLTTRRWQALATMRIMFGEIMSPEDFG